MQTEKASPQQTDKQLMKKLGLADSILHELLCKSRQAIHAGLHERPRYFRNHELQILYMYLLNHAPEKVPVFEEHLDNTKPEDAEKIKALYGFFENPEDIKDAPSLIVVPEFSYLRHENKKAADYLISMSEAPRPTHFLVADDREKELLLSTLLDRKANCEVSVVPDVTALPYMIFCEDGYRGTKGFVLSASCFREMPGYRTQQILERLYEWMGREPGGAVTPIAAKQPG